MSRNEERELFLKYLADIYLQNPTLPISYDTIYHMLSKFFTYDGKQYNVSNESLVGVQVGLNNKFRSNNKVKTFTSRDGYFWAIENRMGKNDYEFLSDVANSIKIYVSVDIDNIYKISESLFNFMIEEDIVMQCKIAKVMRNDALVCRVMTKEDAKKVSDYLNGLDYKSNVRPNPFLLDNGKVSMAMDGRLSYNRTLTKLLVQYFNLKRNAKKLNEVSSLDFKNFVRSQIDMLDNKNKNYFMDLYGITDEERCKDFIMVCNLFFKNLDNTLSLEELFKYSKVNDVDVKKDYSNQDEDKILYVINALTNYYSVNEIHDIIMKYIETGNINYFTRRDNIRTIISDNFSKEDVSQIISKLGWSAFISACKATYDKYGYLQLMEAIKDIFNGVGITKFTNEYDDRSRLGLIIPYDILKETFEAELLEKGYDINVTSLIDLVINEIEKQEYRKSNGRK